MARLATTSMTTVPGLTSVGTSNLLPLSAISLAWIGTNTTLGAIEPEIKPTCYNGQINPISALGREITNSLLEHKHKPFEKDNILVQ